MRKVVILALAALGALASVLVVAAPASAAVPFGCYRPVYTHNVYRYTSSDTGNNQLRPLTYQQFLDQCKNGTNLTVLTDDVVGSDGQPVNFYYKYPWFNDIVGVTFYDGADGAISADNVPYDLWLQAGAPNPEVVTQPLDLVYNLANDPSTIYLNVGEQSHRLTPGEWIALGSPTPTTIGTIERYPFNGDLYFVAYDDAGKPARTYYLTGTDWASFDFPPAAVTNQIFGDLEFQFQGESAIYLRFPDKSAAIQLSFDAWNSLGQRPPVVYAPTTQSPAKAAAGGALSKGAGKFVLEHHLG